MQYFWDKLEAYSEKIALISENETVSYNELTNTADMIAENVPERSLVFLVCQNKIASVIGYLAFLRKRAVTVLLSSSIDAELFEKLKNIYKPQYIWCPNDFLEDSSCYSFGGYKLISTGNDSPIMNEDLALLVTTSGSTGSPKFVRLSYQNLQSNTEAINTFLEVLAEDKAITTLPMNYVYGLSIINSHLMAGAGLIITEKPVFDKKFWGIFKNYGATTFGTVPYIYEVLDKLHFFNMDFPSLKYITQAGGKLNKALHKKIGKAMVEKGKKLIVMYGASEATARMSYLPPEISEEKAGSIGISIPGGRFELIDTNGKIISESNTIGELVYYGDNVMWGYADNRDDLSKGDEMHGRLLTGDLAKRDDDGYYYIVGRKSRFVKVFGNRVSLSEIEELLSKEDYQTACVGEDNHIRIYTTSNNTDGIIDYISKKTGLNRRVFSAYYISSIPRNQAGKIQYSKLENFHKNPSN